MAEPARQLRPALAPPPAAAPRPRMKLFADALPARPIAAPAPRLVNLAWARDQLVRFGLVAAAVAAFVRFVWR